MPSKTKNAVMELARWLGANVLTLLFGAIALIVSAIAMSQSYHFGLSLGITDTGKQSMAWWMAVIDLCTAALPIGAVAIGRMGYRKVAWSLLLPITGYMLFSMTNQTGFALAERTAKSEQAKAIKGESKEAIDARNKFIEKQLKWNNGTAVNRDVLRSSRQESIASTERLIASVGEVDPNKVYAPPEDPQATGLADLTGKTPEFIQRTLAIWAAILVILAKPLFWALATFFYVSLGSVRFVTVLRNRSDGNDGGGGGSGTKPSTKPRTTVAAVPSVAARSATVAPPVAPNVVPMKVAVSGPDAALRDLQELLARKGYAPSQQALASRWQLSKGRVSHLVSGWESAGKVQRVRKGRFCEIVRPMGVGGSRYASAAG